MMNQLSNNLSRRKFITKSSAAILGLGALGSLQFACAKEKALADSGLKDLFKDDFKIGTSIGPWNWNIPGYMDLLQREFNAITATNSFKWERIHPEIDKWDFEFPDKFVEYGLANDMYMVGHVLLWHSQTPDWLFVDDGKQVSKAELTRRMESHIGVLVDRYKGKFDVWDAVNESIDFSTTGESAKGWRKTKWLEIMGSGFNEMAFNLAHEADPDVQLIYNDYEMQDVGRRDFVVEMIRDFKKRGVPIHGIGMQAHVYLDHPTIEEMDAAITAFAREGMRIHITEMDVDCLPNDWIENGAEISTSVEYSDKLNPYVDGLPQAVSDKLARRYEDLFRLFLKHKDSIDRVTTWGAFDGESWKNNFPVRGRTNYPLLFDRDLKRKPAYDAVANLKS